MSEPKEKYPFGRFEGIVADYSTPDKNLGEYVVWPNLTEVKTLIEFGQDYKVEAYLDESLPEGQIRFAHHFRVRGQETESRMAWQCKPPNLQQTPKKLIKELELFELSILPETRVQYDPLDWAELLANKNPQTTMAIGVRRTINMGLPKDADFLNGASSQPEEELADPNKDIQMMKERMMCQNPSCIPGRTTDKILVTWLQREPVSGVFLYSDGETNFWRPAPFYVTDKCYYCQQHSTFTIAL